MEETAQGALEYLLLIGGAVLVAAIVIALIGGMTATGGTQAEGAQTNAGGALTNLYQ